MSDTSRAAVETHIAALPPDRRDAMVAVRETILEHLPDGYEEGMQWGMISYHVPLERFAETYNGQPLSYAALASLKSHMTLHLMAVYGNPETEAWFRQQWAASGKRLDMGKSCVRFKRVEDLPLELIGATIAGTPVESFIRQYQDSRRKRSASR